MTSTLSVLAAFAVILLDLAGRAGLDKVLALAGTPALVAMWAQLQSVVELISGVALTGLAPGLTVLIAQAKSREDVACLLRAATRLCLSIALGGAALFLLASLWLRPEVAQTTTQTMLLLASMSGCILVIPGLMSAYWLGQHKQQRVLQFALLGILPWTAVAWAVFKGAALQQMMLAQCAALMLIALPMGWYLHRLAGRSAHPPDFKKLAHFIPVGLAIGIMSPASMLLVRGIIAAALSWDDAGLMQALWRASDWVTGAASGVLSLIFLPRLSATSGTKRFGRELGRAAYTVLLPTALLLLLIYLNQRTVLATLYDARFAVSDRAVALFMLGSWLRVASWVFLYGLYAVRRTLLLVAGEVLSLPLLVLLLWLYEKNLTLERAALLYCVTYIVYMAFNAVALLYSRLRHP
jgi:PST family polysaccharide transporter